MNSCTNLPSTIWNPLESLYEGFQKVFGRSSRELQRKTSKRFLKHFLLGALETALQELLFEPSRTRCNNFCKRLQTVFFTSCYELLYDLSKSFLKNLLISSCESFSEAFESASLEKNFAGLSRCAFQELLYDPSRYFWKSFPGTMKELFRSSWNLLIGDLQLFFDSCAIFPKNLRTNFQKLLKEYPIGIPSPFPTNSGRRFPGDTGSVFWKIQSGSFWSYWISLPKSLVKSLPKPLEIVSYQHLL